MSNDINISDLDIEKYFDGELPKEKIAAFEEKVVNDALFAREVREHRQMRLDLSIIRERHTLSQLMDQIHEQEYGKIPKLLPEKEQGLESENPKAIEQSLTSQNENETQRSNRVISFKTFYLSVGAAATLAALITLGSVWILNQPGESAYTSASGYQDLLMEESQEKRADSSSDRTDRHGDRKVVSSVSKKYVATAFAIAKDGYFVTNNHVVEDCSNLKLKTKTEDGKWVDFEAKVILNDTLSDLALVQVMDSTFTELGVLPFTFSSKGAQMGQDVFTLGYPKKDVVMEPGTISSTTGLYGDTTAYQLAMSLNTGNSGGPIFNTKGEVVAVVKGKHNGKEGTGYAVRVEYMLDLIEEFENENSIRLKKPRYNQIQYKSRVNQINHIRQFVFLVEAVK